MFFLGFAVGPTIGAFLIKHPFIPVFSPAIGVHNGAPTVTSVFYVGATASFINLMLAIFLFPESLHKKKAKMAATQSLLPATPASLAAGEPAKQGVISRFFSPFTLFMPSTVHGPNGTKHTDWSMTLLAMVLFGYLLSNVSLLDGRACTIDLTTCSRVSSRSSISMRDMSMVGVLSRFVVRVHGVHVCSDVYSDLPSLAELLHLGDGLHSCLTSSIYPSMYVFHRNHLGLPLTCLL